MLEKKYRAEYMWFVSVLAQCSLLFGQHAIVGLQLSVLSNIYVTRVVKP